MKKVVLVSLLAATTVAPCALIQPLVAQAQAGGGVQMSQEEYAKYNTCATATAAAAKITDCEAYLTAYPNSAVKIDILNQLLYAYSQTGDEAKTLDAAERVLAVDPQNLRALTLEVYYRRSDGDKLTDPAAKQAALDKAATYAETGLKAAKPADMDQPTFEKLKAAASPTFESAIADDDLAKKDDADAIKELKQEIDENPDQTKTPSPVLQDVYVLAQAYYTSTPPDYLNCAWYATRVADFAPDPYKTTANQLATYCYTKYHGTQDGYAAMQTLSQTHLDPPPVCAGATKPVLGAPAAGATPAAGAAPATAAAPATGATPTASTNSAAGGECLNVSPAPKPEDVIKNLIATTPDLAALAISDREFVLEYGAPDDAQKVFSAVQGKSVEIPGAIVVSATADQVQVSVSPDAVQSKTADFTFNMKESLKKVPNVGDTVTLDGTYASYTQKPLMITMSDASVVVPKPAHAPVHRTTRRR